MSRTPVGARDGGLRDAGLPGCKSPKDDINPGFPAHRGRCKTAARRRPRDEAKNPNV
jgi:hypothetical protein